MFHVTKLDVNDFGAKNSVLFNRITFVLTELVTSSIHCTCYSGFACRTLKDFNRSDSTVNAVNGLLSLPLYHQ